MAEAINRRGVQYPATNQTRLEKKIPRSKCAEGLGGWGVLNVRQMQLDVLG